MSGDLWSQPIRRRLPGTAQPALGMAQHLGGVVSGGTVSRVVQFKLGGATPPIAHTHNIVVLG